MNTRDVRSDSSANSKNPLTGLQTPGGIKDVQVVDLGNGVGALVTIAATRTKTTPAASTSSAQALAADITRVAVSIQNNDTVAMAVGLGVAAVVGTNAIPPGGIFVVPSAFISGVINIIWATGGSVAATVLATTA